MSMMKLWAILVCVGGQLLGCGQLNGSSLPEAIPAPLVGGRGHFALLHVEALLLHDLHQVDAGLLQQCMAAEGEALQSYTHVIAWTAGPSSPLPEGAREICSVQALQMGGLYTSMRVMGRHTLGMQLERLADSWLLRGMRPP